MNPHKRGAEPGSSPDGKRQLLHRKLSDEITLKQKPSTAKPGMPKENSVKGGQYFMVLRLNSSITSDSSLTQWPCIVCDEKSHDFLFLGRRLFKPASEAACRLSGNFTDGKMSKPDVPAIPVILLFLNRAAVDDSTVRILMDKSNNYPADFTSACRMMLEKRSLKWHVGFMSKNSDAALGLPADKLTEHQASAHGALVPHVIIPQPKNLHSGFASEQSESSEKDTDEEYSGKTAGIGPSNVNEYKGTAAMAANVSNQLTPSFSESSDDFDQDAYMTETVKFDENSGQVQTPELSIAHNTHVKDPADIQHPTIRMEHGTVKEEVPAVEQSMEYLHVKKEPLADQSVEPSRIKDEELLHGENGPNDDIFNSPPCGEDQVRIFLKGGVQKFLDRKVVDSSKFLGKKLEKHMERGEFFVKCHTVEQISETEFVAFVQFFRHGDFMPLLDEADPDDPEILDLDLHDGKCCQELAMKCIRLCLVAEAIELPGLVHKAFGKLKILLPICNDCSSEFVKVMRLIGFGNDVEIKMWTADYAAKQFYKLIEQDEYLVQALKNDSDFSTMVHRRMAGLPALDAKELKKRKGRSKKPTPSSGTTVTTPKSGAKLTPKKQTPSKPTPSKTAPPKQAAKKAGGTPSKMVSKKSGTTATKSPAVKKTVTKSKTPVLAEPSGESDDDDDGENDDDDDGGEEDVSEEE